MNSRLSDVFISGVRSWSKKKLNKSNLKQNVFTRICNQWRWHRQTNKENSGKNIWEFEKEAASEQVNWYSVKKCKDHGGPITNIKEFNKLV